MWPRDAGLEKFQALPFRDKWRVNRSLARGEAPRDPRMAAAAVELAEWHQRKSRHHRAWMRWAPFVLLILAAYPMISDAVGGDMVAAAVAAAAVLGIAFDQAFNPATRPKNMARSLEASRRVAVIAAAED